MVIMYDKTSSSVIKHSYYHFTVNQAFLNILKYQAFTLRLLNVKHFLLQFYDRRMETIRRMTIMILNFWHIHITTNVPINGKITSIPCLISSNGKLQSRHRTNKRRRDPSFDDKSFFIKNRSYQFKFCGFTHFVCLHLKTKITISILTKL